MDDAVVGENCIVGAGSLVTQSSVLEAGYLYIGRPARRLRSLSDEEIERIRYSAAHYVKLKNQHAANIETAY